ncbi:MAG TPA: hypothetical protein DEB33_01995 [Gemmatimonadetes bacterium]|nr:hypothetical protein [Gemmatimonadota bacterium]
MGAAGRLSALERMVSDRPDDSRLRFGLALEYLHVGRTEDAVSELRLYLNRTDDEGNGWGRLGSALLELGRDSEAREAYEQGIASALRHGHPTMADEFTALLQDI